MKNVVLCDWDIAYNSPANNHYTVASLNEVDALMNSWIEKNIDQFWIGYKTPAGARAFLASKEVDYEEHLHILKSLRTDRLYLISFKKRKTSSIRMSPKRNRKNDYIACFWKTWGNGLPILSIENTIKIHDKFLKSGYRYYQ